MGFGGNRPARFLWISLPGLRVTACTTLSLAFFYFKLEGHVSCEIDNIFVQTHIFKLRVMLRSRVVRGLWPREGLKSVTPWVAVCSFLEDWAGIFSEVVIDMVESLRRSATQLTALVPSACRCTLLLARSMIGGPRLDRLRRGKRSG